MKNRLFVFAGVFLGLCTNRSAQETHRLRGDDAAVVVAVVEWFGPKATELARKQGTLVVSKGTNTRRMVGSAVMGGASDVQTPDREYFEFPAQAFRGVEKATGLRIEYCDTYDRATQSLCGIAEPWAWMVFSAPLIDGDNAVIGLEDGSLDSRPSPKRRINYTLFNIYLQRKGGRWVVVGSERTGAT